LAFDALEPIDVALHLSITPRKVESGSDSSIIKLQAGSEADKTGDVAIVGRLQPGIELLSILSAEQGGEVTCEVGSALDFRVQLTGTCNQLVCVIR
jgi:hypothetical protein